MEIHWRNVAALAYEKYVAHIYAKGNPIIARDTTPTFEQLTQVEQQAWVLAVMEACDVFGRAVTA